MNKSFSKSIGELFAHIQDLMDTAIYSIIKKTNENSNKRNRLLAFFSSVAESYFKKYSEIKKSSKHH
jgi:hypothetical protein|tara:strand:- start:1088 stop:1288 length:201 start_codon:yes stop_codon:yes gene_type:complete